MRARRLALAAAALLLALALAACSGSAATPEATSTPAPTAVATPEAASTPAPAAAATPEAASTPAETGAGGAPVPGAASLSACSNGIAIADPTASEGLVRDCALLLDGKDALRGTTPLDWSASVSMAEWKGVRIRVPGSDGPVRPLGPLRVTGIHLRGKGLTGVIPPQLGYLTELTSLDLAGNSLTGAIPPELANLAALEQLLAGGNRLTGEIPAGFGLSRGLHTLDLSDNRLTGTIPDLSQLAMLRHLDLRGNGLAGGIPAWLGDMRELAVLRLDGNRLGGPVPRGIGRLPLLREAFLGGRNALTGCVPSRFEDIESDAASLGLPWCLRYDRLDAAGEVASAGEWAILGGNGEALTTWEQLRSEAATLRVHQTDAGGNSWASEFGAVAVNDLFEWRLADDCWVRYRVAGEPTPLSGASGRWEFPVEWITYAATGADCTGAVGAGTVLSMDESTPSTLSVYAIDAPVRHGAYLVYSADWTGERESPVRHELPASETEGVSGADGMPSQSGDDRSVYVYDLADARRLIAHWRDPVLPAGWTFLSAESGGDYASLPNYCAAYQNDLGYLAVRFCLTYLWDRPVYYQAVSSGVFYEPRVIGGHAAIVIYSPAGPTHRRLIPTGVSAFDASSGIQYWLSGEDRRMLGSNVDQLIEIALGLLPPPTPK